MIGRSTHNFLLRVSITRYSYFLNKHVSILKQGVSYHYLRVPSFHLLLGRKCLKNPTYFVR